MQSILRGLIARLASLVPSAIATLLASRLILQHYDVEVFNAFTLIFTIMVLIPLNDLGAGAALTSAVATNGTADPHTSQVALTAARVLAMSGIALALLALGLSAAGAWGDVLGDGSFATGAFGIAIAAYGLSFVPGLAQSALLGVNRNEITILVQASLAPAMAAGAGICVLLDADPRWLVVVPGVAVLVISLLNAVVSTRDTGLRLLPLVPKLPRRKRYPGTRIRGIAGPALIVSLISPLALQMDRLVLSHVSTSQDVANYSVTIQVFAPLVALIPAAARPLWPIFARARATGAQALSMGKVLALFVGLTSMASVVLVALAQPIAQVISDDKIDLGIALPVLMAVAAVVQSVAVPVSMALMYPAGLRVIARLAVVSLPVNLGLSIWAGHRFGAPGPLGVGIFVGTFLQTVPALAYLARHGITSQPVPADDEASFLPLPPTEEGSVFVDGNYTLAAEPVGGRSIQALGADFSTRWRETEHGRTWD